MINKNVSSFFSNLQYQDDKKEKINKIDNLLFIACKSSSNNLNIGINIKKYKKIRKKEIFE